jgi:hypothetical protein
MAEESGQDKTEEPTAQRLSKAREEGQIARSQELAPAAMMVMMGQYLFSSMGNLFKSQLQFDRKITDKAELLPAIFGSAIVDGFVIVLPLIAIMAVIAALSTTLSGGLIFAPKLALPKFSKLNPMTGLKRMFGTDALIQLGFGGRCHIAGVGHEQFERLDQYFANGFRPSRKSCWHHHCGFLFLAESGFGLGGIGGRATAAPPIEQETQDDQTRGQRRDEELGR